ncbi:hypothetical protein BC629DRAFT_921269 [Irpex lacteus]|nr:hypothetical protein BC629DRAFT_921269 [Irpex lacteus]
MLWTSLSFPSQQLPIKAMLDEAHPVQVIYSNDGEGIDAVLEKAMNTKKNKHSILRVVKKAGASAKKFAHKTKSLTMRREHKMAIHVKDLFDVPAVPHNTPALGPSIAVFEPEEHSSPPKLVLFGPTESVESLAATLGSPTTLSAFPISPPIKFALRPPPSASLVQSRKPPASSRAYGCRLLLKAVIFLPYALAVGFLPLLAPAHLSHIAFSSIFGYASQPKPLSTATTTT